MQRQLTFPDVELADETGLLAVGGELSVQMLLAAYSSGIFPWPIEEFSEIPWFAPAQRAVLFFKDLSISRSMRKLSRNHPYELRFNSAFIEVVRGCAAKRASQSGTWITEEIIKGYSALHAHGFALSVECFAEDKLVGGLYGVSIGGFFAGESMFHLSSNTSKLCLLYLIEHLAGQGVEWIDCQQSTPLLDSFGARCVPRTEFMKLLAVALEKPQLRF